MREEVAKKRENAFGSSMEVRKELTVLTRRSQACRGKRGQRHAKTLKKGKELSRDIIDFSRKRRTMEARKGRVGLCSEKRTQEKNENQRKLDRGGRNEKENPGEGAIRSPRNLQKNDEKGGGHRKEEICTPDEVSQHNSR